MIMDLLAWDPIDNKMGVVDTYHPKTGKVMFEKDTWDWYKRDRIVRRPTGIKAKNGIDIYEGDIMDSNDSGHLIIKGMVDFRKGRFVLGQTEGREDELHLAVEVGYTVIGNIYENPELLEDKHD